MAASTYRQSQNLRKPSPMRTFIFKINTRLGGWRSVEIDATSEDEAREKLTARGYAPGLRVYATSPWL